MNLTKEQIYNIISNNEIESLYCTEKFFKKTKTTTNDKFYNNNLLQSLTTDEKNQKIYKKTGINILKDPNGTYKLTGKGIKIGNIDWELPDKSLECFSKARSEGRLHSFGNYLGLQQHQTLTTAVMIGEVDGKYKGIAHNADMYCITANEGGKPHTEIWKDKIEVLLSNNVNIINASMSLDGDELNQYQDSAKWVDAIINNQNVLIVQSSGNNSVNHVICGAMAYNSIIVGNLNIEDDSVYSNSAYNSGDGVYKQYKPDIIAPGDITVYYSNDRQGVGSGTSCAAPIVSGIAALLCERYPSLKSNPTFLKSLMINSATYLGDENTVGSNTDFVAFDRKSGAGIVNGYRAINCYSSRNWDTGTASAYSVANYSFYVPKKTITNNASVSDNEKKKVHVTVCAEKTNSFADSTVNLADQTPIDSFLPAFEVKVWNTENNLVYTSRYLYDNKCSVVFTPIAGGTYNVQITRIDNNYYPVPCSAFFTCQ